MADAGARGGGGAAHSDPKIVPLDGVGSERNVPNVRVPQYSGGGGGAAFPSERDALLKNIVRSLSASVAKMDAVASNLRSTEGGAEEVAGLVRFWTARGENVALGSSSGENNADVGRGSAC
eukprot:CAMPEP_0194284392 /NCGR_PEP_ID=MMETSP0169-20130528/27541_1 /TAXON_ID=218684 /ORGANISM="Corethron pennatum, Strain L29A3" /LENGTH=120 /DNA_ID=CAMNT_0039030203 /DNA_START=194 /DNA_END=556 /DNA_ORIENTATION=+